MIELTVIRFILICISLVSFGISIGCLISLISYNKTHFSYRKRKERLNELQEEYEKIAPGRCLIEDYIEYQKLKSQKDKSE